MVLATFAAAPTTDQVIREAAKSVGIAQTWSGSSTQLIGSAESKLFGALEQVREAQRLDRYALVPDRARHNEKVDDRLASAERRLFEALDLILKARAAVAPQEEN
jgi:hypothetical protein